MKKIILSFSIILFGFLENIFAIGISDLSNAPATIKITPVLGFEQSKSVYPDNSVQWKLMYGINVSVGVPLISIEASALRSNSNKVKSSETIDDTTDMIRLGLVSKIYPIPYIGFIVRAGGQGEKRTVKVTPQNESQYVYYKNVRYSPYVGGGVSIPLAQTIALEFIGNAVFKDFPDNLEETTLDYTVGIKIAF